MHVDGDAVADDGLLRRETLALLGSAPRLNPEQDPERLAAAQTAL
jgi:hypothetical protein